MKIYKIKLILYIVFVLVAIIITDEFIHKEDNNEIEEKEEKISPITKTLEKSKDSPISNAMMLDQDLAELIFDDVEELQELAKNKINYVKDNAAHLRGKLNDSSNPVALHLDLEENNTKTYFVDGTHQYNSSYLFNYFFIGSVSISEYDPPKREIIAEITSNSEIADRIIGSLRTLLELKRIHEIITEDKNGIVFYDGSFITLITQMNMISSLYDGFPNDELWQSSKVGKLLEFYQTDFLFDILDSRRVFAIPKRTTRSQIQEQIFGGSTGVSDMALFSLLLKKEEYALHETKTLRKLPRGNIGRTNTNLKIGKRKSILHYYTKRGFQFVYFRGYDWSPANRIEIPNAYENFDQLKINAKKVLNIIYQNTKYPELRQPYMMYIVDLLAKQLSQASRAHRAAVDDPLSKEFLSTIKNIGILFHNYRP